MASDKEGLTSSGAGGGGGKKKVIIAVVVIVIVVIVAAGIGLGVYFGKKGAFDSVANSTLLCFHGCPANAFCAFGKCLCQVGFTGFDCSTAVLHDDTVTSSYACEATTLVDSPEMCEATSMGSPYAVPTPTNSWTDQLLYQGCGTVSGWTLGSDATGVWSIQLRYGFASDGAWGVQHGVTSRTRVIQLSTVKLTSGQVVSLMSACIDVAKAQLRYLQFQSQDLTGGSTQTYPAVGNVNSTDPLRPYCPNDATLNTTGPILFLNGTYDNFGALSSVNVYAQC